MRFYAKVKWFAQNGVVYKCQRQDPKPRLSDDKFISPTYTQLLLQFILITTLELSRATIVEFTHLFTKHSFIQQTFTKCLLCTGHYTLVVRDLGQEKLSLLKDYSLYSSCCLHFSKYLMLIIYLQPGVRQLNYSGICIVMECFHRRHNV